MELHFTCKDRVGKLLYWHLCVSVCGVFARVSGFVCMSGLCPCIRVLSLRPGFFLCVLSGFVCMSGLCPCIRVLSVCPGFVCVFSFVRVSGFCLCVRVLCVFGFVRVCGFCPCVRGLSGKYHLNSFAFCNGGASPCVGVLCRKISFGFLSLDTTHKGVNYFWKDVTQTQQQRPETPTVTFTWHASKLKVRNSIRCTSSKETGRMPDESYRRRLKSL